jgi:tetratricopeptide (TPR) repeat protein
MRNGNSIVKVIASLALWALLLPGCQKYLEEKPDASLETVDAIPKAQALLDHHRGMAEQMPFTDLCGADEFYVTQAVFNSLPDYERNAYAWAKEGMYPSAGTDWELIYRRIYRCNVVLKSLETMNRHAGDDSAWNATRASAKFMRGFNYLMAAKIWCNAYDAATAQSDLGLPLRLDEDFEKPSVRSNVEETYRQIIRDLMESVIHLPIKPVHVVRPSRAAAYAILARCYLSMRVYDSAGHYAALCLQLQNQLYDYNLVPNPGANYPLGPQYSHPEIILNLRTHGPPGMLQPNRSRIDTTLYALYADNDLRKTLYFLNHADGSQRFKGSLAGSNVLFQGPTVAEMMLIRSECLARLNNQDSRDQALQLLNQLLEKRYQSGTFVPIVYQNPQMLLDTILAERQKELIFRGERWADIKRLNLEGRNILLRRFVNNEWIQLEPNSPRYAAPIPEKVIDLSGMQQNP